MSEEQKQGRKAKANKFTLLKNVKHNNTRHRAGEEIELNEQEQGQFRKLGLIKGE
ncbi:hypothetical protein [Paenibacillus lautus]|uniref:DUF7210 family protein n=1 Tax=Paenibacillus lautus TaxID=1401 RepID=UPI003D2BF3A3